MTTPSISVVMLTHNRKMYIREAIESVLQQSYSDLELIILDDGSNDGTQEIIKNITDPRIQYNRFEETGEISRLRNIGIQKSRGTFIAFIDSDDVWMPTKLAEQMESFVQYPQSGFGFSDVIEFRGNAVLVRTSIYKKPPGTPVYYGNIFSPLVQNQYVIYPSTAIIKKSCISKTGMVNENLKPGETEFFTRLAYAYDCFISYKPLVNIRKHKENSSDRLKLETVNEMLFSLQQLRSGGKISGKVFRKMTTWYHYLGGMGCLEKHQYTDARREFFMCLRYNPFHPKAWIRMMLTFIQPLF